MKKTILVTILHILQINLFCQIPIGFSVSDVSVETGQIFTVDVKTNNFTQVSSFSFGLKWNPSIIQFDTILVYNADLSLDPSHFNITPTVTDSGKMTVSWFDLSGLGKTLVDDALLFSLQFESFTIENTLIEFSDELTPIIVEDVNGVLPVTTIPGQVTVTSRTNEGLSAFEINLAPNPANDMFMYQFAFGKASTFDVEIMDMTGIVVMKHQFKKMSFGECNFNVSCIPAGLYIVRTVLDSGTLSKKLSINH